MTIYMYICIYIYKFNYLCILEPEYLRPVLSILVLMSLLQNFLIRNLQVFVITYNVCPGKAYESILSNTLP